MLKIPPLSRLMFLLGSGYFAIVAILYFSQDRMLFYPRIDTEKNLDGIAAVQGFAPWKNARGDRIGWESIAGDTTKPVLICMGNAGLALDRAYFRPYLKAQGFDSKIYLLEYPGYGARNGPPNEKSLTDAAIEALDTLSFVPGRQILVLGESLGSGVACALAAARHDRIAGLILVTPFDSLTSAASSHYPWLPISLLLRTKFDSANNLANYRGPLVIIVGEGDRTIPARLGERLYQNAHNPKKLWLAPGAGHDCSEFLGTRWSEVDQFLRSSKAYTASPAI